MKKVIITLLVLIGLVTPNIAKAQPFFDTSDAEKFFSLSGRIGFNTSNRTFPSGNYSNMILTSWGTGFNAGVLANLNFKEYLSLQPGLFFESRSGNLINIVDYLSDTYTKETHYEVDHLRAYYFTVPIMGVVKFNLAEKIKWMVEFGPYLQFCLHETGQNDVAILYRDPQSFFYKYYDAEHRGFDFGFKMGTGIRVFNHYYFGVHYLAGALNAWKNPDGGKNKSWMFTLGYDF
ncbi:MAG: PorT family protein [Muribaculaceae bacterium]|nr:PorT family protein [Muribaculaceae bacterium]